ncbi:MAG: hypothetical protein RBS58_04610 [Syntrophales bacterium]|nr:hypothetical protein [Syntrophales bacterium]
MKNTVHHSVFSTTGYSIGGDGTVPLQGNAFHEMFNKYIDWP